MELKLWFYKDSEDSEYLLEGFNNEFSLHYEGPHVAFEAKNLKSAFESLLILQDKINKEILAGRVAGPCQERPIDFLKISIIGLVLKRMLGEYRLIHHLSYPHGFSVNGIFDPHICSVQYASFDEVVLLMLDLDPNCKLFKMDLKMLFVFCQGTERF